MSHSDTSDSNSTRGPANAGAVVDHVDLINQNRGGYNDAMGIHFVSCTTDEVRAELHVRHEHLQPYGLVHGGVYCSMIETMCSVGAALDAMTRGQTAVGLENSTSFLRAARQGTLHGRATPLSRGRRSQVWQASIHDDDDGLLAVGRVRMICLEAGARAAGEEVGMKASGGDH